MYTLNPLKVKNYVTVESGKLIVKIYVFIPFCKFVGLSIITIYKYIICIFRIHNKIHLKIKNLQIYMCISTVESF